MIYRLLRAGMALLFALLLTACAADPSEPAGEADADARAGTSRDASAADGTAEKPANGSRPSGTTLPEHPSGADGGSSAGMNADRADAAPAGSAGKDAGAVQTPVCPSTAPAEFEANPSIGGGGSQYTDSPHFRIHGGSAAQTAAAIKALEAAYSCFVETLCWRSSGLSIHATSESGPYHKMNIYSVGTLEGAAGQMFSDGRAGLSYLKVVGNSLAEPKVTVHEYGHALTYHEKGWIDQTRTGAWWETVANFVADTYLTSPLCERARVRFEQPEGRTIIDLNKVIGDAQQVIVDGTAGTGNYYQAWPFLTYLTNNPDGYPGLGLTALRDMFRTHMRDNETPLHVLERLASPVRVQTIVGRYWARMAYLDIGHEQAQAAFMSGRGRLNFANLDPMGSGIYRVKAGRRPRYFGANIIPLEGGGSVTLNVSSDTPFTATLAVRSSAGSVRYVDLENGLGDVTLESDEEASLVVVNTPNALYQYDPFKIGGEVASGMDYQVQMMGATPAN